MRVATATATDVAADAAGAKVGKTPPRAFISFAHENDEHDDTVHTLYGLLRKNGCARGDGPARRPMPLGLAEVDE